MKGIDHRFGVSLDNGRLLGTRLDRTPETLSSSRQRGPFERRGSSGVLQVDRDRVGQPDEEWLNQTSPHSDDVAPPAKIGALSATNNSRDLGCT